MMGRSSDYGGGGARSGKARRLVDTVCSCETRTLKKSRRWAMWPTDGRSVVFFSKQPKINAVLVLWHGSGMAGGSTAFLSLG
jgi:hypothetical protein